jgi:hypothetical protein
MWKESCTAVDEFAELRYSLNEVRVDEFSDPFGRFLTVLCLEFDFEHTIPTRMHEQYNGWFRSSGVCT